MATGEGFPGCFAARLSLQPKGRISLASDDSSLEYRRKSAGSPQTTSSHPQQATNNNNSNSFGNINHQAPHQPQNLNASHLDEPYIYAFDDCERHADGTVVLRYDLFVRIANCLYKLMVEKKEHTLIHPLSNSS